MLNLKNIARDLVKENKAYSKPFEHIHLKKFYTQPDAFHKALADDLRKIDSEHDARTRQAREIIKTSDAEYDRAYKSLVEKYRKEMV